MKKLFTLFVMLAAFISASAAKVYYDNSDTKWEKVYTYVWGGDVTGNAKWPGDQMKDEGNNLWSYEFNGTPEKIIFNNGSGSQTGNLTFAEGATFDFYGVKGAAVNEFVVYFDNSKTNWSTVYAYYWDGGITASWPGAQMTQGANNLWSLSIKSQEAPDKILFNNGQSGEGNQTGDFAFTVGATYDKDGILGQGGGNDDPVTPPTPPTPGETVYELYGTFINWESPYQTTTTVEDNCVKFIVENWNGYEFKIVVNGTWYGYVEAPLANGEWYEMGDTGMANTTLASDANGKTVTITFAVDNHNVSASWGEGGGNDDPVTPPTPPTPGSYPETLYLVGTNNNWDTSTSVAAVGVEGVYNWKGIALPAGDGSEYAYFNLATVQADTWDEVNNADRYGAPTKDCPLSDTAPIALYAVNVSAMGCLSWAITPGTYDITADLSSMTIKVVKAGEGGGDDPVTPPTPPTPGDVTYELMGTFTEAAWSAPYMSTNVVTNDIVTFTVHNWNTAYEFKIKVGEKWYGNVDEPLKNGQWYTLSDTGYDNTTLDAAAAGKTVTLSYNVVSNELKAVWAESGIESIAVDLDNAATVIYTLDGRRVNGTPAPGLYIAVQGPKAVKIAIR